MTRTATITRKTRETDITLSVNLDGTGIAQIQTPVGFMDHMLELFTYHSLCNITVHATGDIHVDDHHVIEDIGIVLGKACAQALGDKKGIRRYGYMLLPMDESLSTVAIDLSGRSHLELTCEFSREKIGDFSTELMHDFWQGFVSQIGANIHIQTSGRNDHHKIESVFKGVARALRMAIEIDDRARLEIPSTKGIL